MNFGDIIRECRLKLNLSQYGFSVHLREQFKEKPASLATIKRHEANPNLHPIPRTRRQIEIVARETKVMPNDTK